MRTSCEHALLSCRHRQLTDRLISFILYALALQDIAPAGMAGLSSGGATSVAAAAAAVQLTTEQGINALRKYMGCLGRFADTHTAFIGTMYGAGEIPQAFCRCCAVYGGVYVLRRTMATMLVGTEPVPAPAPAPAPEAAPEGQVPQLTNTDGPGYFQGLVCTAGQRLNARYLVTGWEHIAALRDGTIGGSNGSKQCRVVARAVCITSQSLVDGVGSLVAVLPPWGLPAGNSFCVRLQQYDRNAKLVSMSSASVQAAKLAQARGQYAHTERLLHPCRHRPGSSWCTSRRHAPARQRPSAPGRQRYAIANSLSRADELAGNDVQPCE